MNQVLAVHIRSQLSFFDGFLAHGALYIFHLFSLVSLPKIKKNSQMDFFCWSIKDALSINKFGIPEPSSENCEYELASKMDIIFIPLVSFDRSGNRLGMGGGYYDSTLAEANRGGFSDTLLVGLAHHFQEKRRLWSRSWDIKLDMIITDRELICVKPK